MLRFNGLSRVFCVAAVASFVFLGLPASVLADVIVTGDVDPADPASWTGNTTLYVGKTGSGMLDITSGDTVNSGDNSDDPFGTSFPNYIGYNSGSTGTVTVDGIGSTWKHGYLTVGDFGNGTLNIVNGGEVVSNGGTGIPNHYRISYIGRHSGSTGTVTVDGPGSTWTPSYGLTVGASGSGTLNITNGGEVISEGSTCISDDSGSSGTILFDNGTLTTGGLLCNFDDLTGTGTINTSGLVSDIDLVFDATHGKNQTFNINDNPDQNITINLTSGMGSPDSGWSSLGAGYAGVGTMSISDGSSIESGLGYIGYKSGSTGTVTVDGEGSTWTSNGLYVGNSGNGTLNITNSGEVIVLGEAYISENSGSSGTIRFDNGMLTTGGLLCNFDDLTGTGTINTRGLVSDIDLVFDATHGKNQTFNIDDHPGQNITINLTVNDWSSLGAGYAGIGTMSISDASSIKSFFGYIGYKSGSMGTVTVDGEGSSWDTEYLNVGYSGSGTLDITNGGSVVSGSEFFTPSVIGYESGSTGLVTVDGPGSTWTSSSLTVGDSGNGTLNITDGSTVDSGFVYIGHKSGSTGTVTVDGPGSTWNTTNLILGDSGSGVLNITNGGEVIAEYGTWISHDSGSPGTIIFDNGTLTTGNLLCNFDDITGTGTINTHGLVSNIDLVFDAAHGVEQTLNVNDNPDQNITLNLTVDNSCVIGAGYAGVGTMSISDGISIESNSGLIGCKSGSTGTVTVDGSSSTWSTSHLTIGNSGSGTLNITDGGEVTSMSSYVGCYSSSTGEVTVDGPGSTWTASADLYFGYSGSGTMNISNGGSVSSGNTYSMGNYIGHNSGSTGEVTVDGPGSTWTVSSDLYIGNSGSGTLNIFNGGSVVSNDNMPSAPSSSYIGYNSGSTGTVTVEGEGSSWEIDNLYVGHSSSGAMNIINGGSVVSGSTPVPDPHAYIGYNSGSTGTVMVDGPGSTWTLPGGLIVGHSGSGTLNVTNSGSVGNSSMFSEDNYIGYNSGSTGTVTVNGSGSTWTVPRNLTVGYFGSGTLNISNGGSVEITGDMMGSYIGYNSGSTGEVTVNGLGSTLTVSDSLWIGWEGSGTLNITGGGRVNSGSAFFDGRNDSLPEATVSGPGSTWTINGSLWLSNGNNPSLCTLNITNGGLVTVGENIYTWCYSLLAIDVSNNDMLTTGSNFMHDGTVRLTAEAGLLAGTYTPISVTGSWLGSGTYETFGGMWDETLHTFTVAAAEQANAGQQITFDLSTEQRVDVGSSLCVNFMPTAGSTALDFTATATSGQTLADLQALLSEDQLLQDSWDFDISGLPGGDGVMLSFALTGSPTAEDITIWHHDDINGWTQYDATDLVFADGWANFTVDSFSSYAVTNTPEPATMCLLAVGGLALLRRKRSA
ncbi:MAG: PEP-CTERM sorting domain-containing protein [Phycisphaerae bacterium]|nr:PEP-CTERM sorting domain-containing protein [Phycisphaerae bacterium]